MMMMHDSCRSGSRLRFKVVWFGLGSDLEWLGTTVVVVLSFWFGFAGHGFGSHVWFSHEMIRVLVGTTKSVGSVLSAVQSRVICGFSGQPRFGYDSTSRVSFSSSYKEQGSVTGDSGFVAMRVLLWFGSTVKISQLVNGFWSVS
ncbi:hypothetical protein Hdeb2414_s0004g00132931 [Helianthus debilis subsp. tardiflorus]